MQKNLYKTKSTYRNEIQVDLVKSGLEKLKNDIKKMSKHKINIEKSNKIVNSVEKILDFNYLNQEGQGLKMLTSQQMLSRLPISLAQVEAGNSSGKLKNKIRKLLYYLYQSKMLSKTIYKHLVSII